MQNKEIHIVSFDIPFPPNYGGIIDVYYKIKALFDQGISVNLHCFKYHNIKQVELNKICKSVTYYDRPLGFKYFLSNTPYIVNTRSNWGLLNNLSKDDLPILFEGLHTTYYLNELKKLNPSRKIVVRTHNIEHDYYNALGKQEKKLSKKIYYLSEARKLKNYERILKSDISIACITEKDTTYFRNKYTKGIHIPAFHPNNDVESIAGKGNYILFHGNLSVNENIKTAEFIIDNIAPEIKYKLIFAGKNPDKKLNKRLNKIDNINLLSNPNDKEMKELIQNAHINLLLTSQSTGIKLKLLNSLYLGRFCIANNKMVEEIPLASLCLIKNSKKEIIDCIQETMQKEFSNEQIEIRKHTLLKFVNNTTNAQNLINLL